MSRILQAALFISLPFLACALWTPAQQATLASHELETKEMNETINYWFNFGDSYSETGFTINGTAPTPGNPMGNPPYPGRTASSDGGANWVGFLTTKYNNSLLLTYNFAWGGATINRSVILPTQDISYDDQIRNFTWWNSAHGNETSWASNNTLFSSWIGINDIKMTYNLGGNRSEFYDQLLDDEFQLVEELSLYNIRVVPYQLRYGSSTAGARNWLFVNIPPIDRTPEMLSNTEANQALQKSTVEAFNIQLAAKVKDFKDRHSDVAVWSFDSHTLFTAILDNPKDYGFVDATSEGPGAFWGNSYHPSSLAQEIIAQEVAKLLSDTPW